MSIPTLGYAQLAALINASCTPALAGREEAGWRGSRGDRRWRKRVDTGMEVWIEVPKSSRLKKNTLGLNYRKKCVSVGGVTLCIDTLFAAK